MKIALDMDGCLADFTSACTRTAKGLGLTDHAHTQEEQLTYDYAFDMKEVWEHIDSTPNWWTTLSPLFTPDEAAQLNRLAVQHDFYIVTNRKDSPVGATQAAQIEFWLDSLGVEAWRMVNISTNTHRGDKGRVAKALGVTLAWDDMIENLDDYESNGIKAVCRGWNYNTERTYDRVSGLGQFLDLYVPTTQIALI